MGQQQTKLANDRVVHPAFAAHDDPPRPHTAYAQPTHSSLPPLSPPPHSAPMLSVPTDQTFSRIDYTPGGALPPTIASFATKRKNLVRKLSAKAKSSFPDSESSGTTRSKRVEDELKDFEALVAAAESRAGIENMESVVPVSGRTIKASTFAATRAKRSSLSVGSTTSTPTPVPFPTARPGVPRRMSSISARSRQVSLKSAGRAEREWRAKVASLARAINEEQEQFEHRGPVPPKRTPAPNRVAQSTGDGTDSPGSDHIVTPPHPTSHGTPAKSIVSNRSFETLGHYHSFTHTAAPPPLIDPSEIDLRDRKASVPHSISSFYYDQSAISRLSTRPSSFATGHLLPTVPADGSPLSKYSTADEVDGEVSLSPSHPHRITLPPFESFHVSPPAVHAPLSPLRTPTTTKFDEANLVRKVSSGPDDGMTIMTESYDGKLQVAIQRDVRECRVQSLPARPRKSPARLSLHLSVEAGPSSPALNYLSPTATPRRHPSYSPSTPLSPTTNYILTAPIDSINWSTTSPEMRRRSRAPHPYAVVPTEEQDSMLPTPSPPPICPIPSLRQESHRLDIETQAASPQPRQFPSGLLEDAGMILPDPFASPSRSRVKSQKSKKGKGRDKEKERRQTTPSVLQVRRSQPKAAILGRNHDEVDDLRRHRETMKKMGVDLTPGIESGIRPPKSGLPVADLEKWLQQTSIEA